VDVELLTDDLNVLDRADRECNEHRQRRRRHVVLDLVHRARKRPSVGSRHERSDGRVHPGHPGREHDRQRDDAEERDVHYHPSLATTAHVRGVASESWALELSHVDRLVADVAERLPSGAALIVIGDHGVVDVAEGDRIELADYPALTAGVTMVAGEGRARHVYARPGAASDVLSAWRELLGDRMWVVSGEEAIEEDWFDPVVGPEARWADRRRGGGRKRSGGGGPARPGQKCRPV